MHKRQGPNTQGGIAQRTVRYLLVLMMALTALSFVPAGAVNAATGQMFLGSASAPGSTRATDPHGNVWLPGTVDGTTTGAMDTGIDASLPSYGHLWTTDVPSGFCRIIPAVTDGTGAIAQQAVIDRNTAGGCIVAGGKVGGPALDSRRNADGTFYVYAPDWAVRSAGVYRMTYDPGAQIMTKAELLAPNRYPFDNKPFDVQLGADNKLYVSNDKDPNIARITGVNGPLSSQTVETSIAKASDGKRVRAITFACWSNLATLAGGAGATRAPGAPGCTAQDPAPDLVLAQFNTITVVLNAETCQLAAGGCTTLSTPIKVLTPMGLRTDPKDATVIYVSDSPGATATIKRYTISTDIQDTYATYGILEDGTLSQFSFAFDVGFDPQHAMYVGDDPTAGSTAFNGRYFRTAPNAPASVVGAPGAPAAAEIAPTPHNGTMYGGSFTGVAPSTTAIGPPSVAYSALTLPADGIWMGTHLWMADAAGMCRMDVPAGGTLAFLNTSTCMIGANAAGLAKAEQSAFNPVNNFLYVADGGGTKSVGVVRFTFDPATETLGNAQLIAPQLIGTGQGIDEQRADAVALDTANDVLYVGFRGRNLGANTQIARVHNASADPRLGTQNVDFVAHTTRSTPAFGLGLISNTDGTKDLYISNGKGVDVLFNVNACPAGACTDVNLLNVRAPKGFTTDGKDTLYMAGPPAPGTGSSTTLVQSYKISTGELLPFASVGVNPDGLQQQFAFVFSLTLDPNTGDLYVADNAQAVAPPNGVGNVWLVKAGQNGPGQPVFTAKPGSFTNNTTPSFAFTSTPTPASYQCSLVVTGTSDKFNSCTSPYTVPTTAPLADGNYTFKAEAIDAAGVKSIPGIVSFTLDTVVPVVTISAAATSPTKVNTPSYTFAATKNGAAATVGIAYQCSLSSGADQFAACGSPQQYPAQPDGTYTFKAHATDLAGNVSADATSTLTIDTAIPVVTASPAGGQYATAQSVTLTANEPATIHYTTDGTAPTAASTTYTTPIAINASSTLQYIAIDAVGNQSAVGSQLYAIGTVTITAKPANPSASVNPSFTFAAGATSTCALTTATPVASDFTACTSPKTYANVTSGSYTFTVNGFDATGASLGSSQAAVTIDTAAPSRDANPADPSISSTETFAFSKASVGTAWTFQCSFVAAATADSFAACASPKSYTGVSNGTYTFKVQAVDGAGVATNAITYTFAVQGTPPSVTPPSSAPVQSLTTARGTNSTTAVPVTLTWGTSPDAVGYEVQQQINGNVFAPVTICATAPCNITSAVVNVRPDAVNNKTATTYRFQVRAINNAGASSNWVMAPSFSITAQDNNQSISLNGGWSGVNLGGAFGGSVSESSTQGATAQNSNSSTMNTGVTGGSLAWVSTMGPDRGTADVFIDGTKVASVDLYSPTPQVAQIVWTSPNNLTGNHTIQIKVGMSIPRTSGGTGSKVDIDAFLAVKQ